MAARSRPDIQTLVLLRLPIAQDYRTPEAAVRDAAVGDPAGNLIRVQELPKGHH